jgi:hypothetical protein
LDISISRTPTHLNTAIFRNPPSRTPWFLSHPITPCNTNMPPLDTCTTDSIPMT